MTTYCTNMRTGEMTRYDNFEFISFGTIGTKVYGIKADGMYELSGDTDDGDDINAYAVLHKSRLDSASPSNDLGVHSKRVHTMYLEAGDDRVRVTPYVDGVKMGLFDGQSRVRMARGPRGRYWGFKIENVGGDDLRINEIEAIVEVSRRKE